MPRYHFTLTNSVVHLDPEGEELPDLEAAREVAVRYLTEVVIGRTETLWRDGSLSVTISDETPSKLLEIRVVVSCP